MKTIFKRFMPVLAFTVAIAGALITNKTQAAPKSTIVQGYINTPIPCTLSRECNNLGDAICTISGVQVWGMQSAGDCSVKLFHRN